MTVRELSPLISNRTVTFWLPTYPNGSRYPIHLRQPDLVFCARTNDPKFQEYEILHMETRYENEEAKLFIFLK